MKASNVPNEVSAAAQHPDYKTEIVEVLRSNLTPKIKRDRVLDYHENDIAAALEMLSAEERGRLYHLLDAETLADILEYADDKTQYMGEIGIQKRVAVLSQFDITETAEYIRNVDKADRAMLIELLGDEIKTEIMLMNSFSEDEIGSKMTTN